MGRLTINSILFVSCVTAYNNYCRPELTDSESDGTGIRLEEARHPCVELQENVEYIPNNVELIHGESSFMILTGPNVSHSHPFVDDWLYWARSHLSWLALAVVFRWEASQRIFVR
jgi:hypothetical protein